MKIQNKYLLRSFFLIWGIVSTLYVMLEVSEDNEMGIAFWGFLGAITICVYVSSLCKFVLWTSRARRFKIAFSVNPPNNPSQAHRNGKEWKKWSATQPIVDAILKHYALELDLAYKSENSIKDVVPESLQVAQLRHNRMLEIAPTVQSAYDDFWDKRNLAWEWGFEVWDSQKDYVSALNRTGKEKNKKRF